MAIDNRAEVRAFLTTRRAKVSPEQAGVASTGSRRVAGLRRGEVAAIAGVSVEYYTRLERGNLTGVSDSVLEAIGRALHLNDTELDHLHQLARAAGPPSPRTRRRPHTPELRPAVLRLLDSMTGVPAFLRDHRFDIHAANPLGRALYAPMFTTHPDLPVNSMRFTFLGPHAEAFYPQWAQTARSAVGALRTTAARHPDDQQLMNLIGELSMRSEPFSSWWAAQDVFVHRHGIKKFRHPAVGDLELAYEGLELSGEQDLTIVTYSAAPGTPSGDGLQLLARWAATQTDHTTSRTA